MKTPQSIFLDTLQVGEKMHSHLERSYHQLDPIMPIGVEQVPRLSNEAIDKLDLYLSRFGKLQDFIVGKLFRALARASLEDISQDVSALDTLNRMAKFGVIDDIDPWLTARLLRNAFAHEYLSDDTEIANNVNQAWQLYGLLNDALTRSRRFYDEHIA